jgi:8-oxo-dGTP diphosphatase
MPPAPIHVVGIAIIDGGQCLVAQRSERTSFPLCWEFPGGKVEPDEAPIAALEREIKEELDVVVAVGSLLGQGRAPAGDREIVLDVFAGTIVEGTPRAIEHRALRWCTAEELGELTWAPADVPVVPSVQAALRTRS